MTYNLFEEPLFDDWVSSKDLFTNTGEKFYTPSDALNNKEIEDDTFQPVAERLSRSQQWSAEQDNVATPYQNICVGMLTFSTLWHCLQLGGMSLLRKVIILHWMKRRSLPFFAKLDPCWLTTLAKVKSS